MCLFAIQSNPKKKPGKKQSTASALIFALATMASSDRRCYHLGIDCGTQGLSVVLCDGSVPSHRVLAVGEGSYDMLPVPPSADQSQGQICEQNPSDWIDALRSAMVDLGQKMTSSSPSSSSSWEDRIASIGITGQMHGETLLSSSSKELRASRLWCDGRNTAEGDELTALFGVKVPKRCTIARFLWTMRNQPDVAEQTRHITTPAGYIAHSLTGEHLLGVGEASGMFPISQSTLDYDGDMIAKFDALVAKEFGKNTSILDYLPKVRLAGMDGGTLTAEGAAILGLSEDFANLNAIPVAPAEGDQVAALAGSLIADPGQVSCSFGTSVCANSVGDRPFQGVSAAVDHFCAADGRPINMVWLVNGTTFMNTTVEMFGSATGMSRSDSFAAIMPKVLEAPVDCGGLLALPFMHDEPGLNVTKAGLSGLHGLNTTNATAGNAVKAALLSVMFNLQLGSDVLTDQGYPRTELILSGGVTKTPELGQILADVFNAKVTLFDSAEEGTAWGAALMGAYRHSVLQSNSNGADGGESRQESWSDYLARVDKGEVNVQYLPDASRHEAYNEVYERYKQLVKDVVIQST